MTLFYFTNAFYTHSACLVDFEPRLYEIPTNFCDGREEEAGRYMYYLWEIRKCPFPGIQNLDGGDSQTLCVGYILLGVNSVRRDFVHKNFDRFWKGECGRDTYS